MRIRLSYLFLAAAAVATAACANKDDKSNGCGFSVEPGIVIAPGIDLQIRDPFGRGQAIGTTVVTRKQDAQGETGGSVGDTLNIYTAYNVSGIYSVTLSRRYYRDTTIANIDVVPGDCGLVRTTRLPVVLQLAAGAPPVRAVTILGADYLATPGAHVQLIPHFDANPDASTTVTWQVSDATLATVDANGVVTAKCSKSGGTEQVTVTSSADPTVTATVNIGVAPAASCGP